MGGLRITKGEKPAEVKAHMYLSKCNDCECNVNLTSSIELKNSQLDELHKRMLCSKCLNKGLEVKK